MEEILSLLTKIYEKLCAVDCQLYQLRSESFMNNRLFSSIEKDISNIQCDLSDLLEHEMQKE